MDELSDSAETHARLPSSGVTPPPTRFTAGTVLADRYRIVAPLGRGGMGDVYRADDRPSSIHAVIAAMPGGDPLQAAIDAGETPSPEMLAASGESGELKPADDHPHSGGGVGCASRRLSDRHHGQLRS